MKAVLCCCCLLYRIMIISRLVTRLKSCLIDARHVMIFIRNSLLLWILIDAVERYLSITIGRYPFFFQVRSRGDELRNNRKGAPAARLVFQQSLATHPASESFHFLSGITPRVRQGYDAATELSETTATVQPPFSTLRFVDDAVLRTPAIFYLYRSAAQRGTP